jgi:threonine dehydratase
MYQSHAPRLPVSIQAENAKVNLPNNLRIFMTDLNAQAKLTAPQFQDIVAAANRLHGKAVHTPLLQSDALNALVGRQVFIKPETLQIAGSFKFRGAYNRLSQLNDAQRKAGVVAWSSGNHAQGVAAAAARLNIPATIVMPADAPVIKRDNTIALGAKVVAYDRLTQSREAISYQIAEETGAVVVPSFDDPDIIAGQGTCGFEIANQISALGAPLDALFVCCGGGGLIAGTAIAMRELSPSTQIYSVEPAGYDDHARSLKSGARERADTSHVSICDALLAPMPGELTWSINHHLLAGGLVVSDDEVCAAVVYAYNNLKLVVEPGGAVALAALLAGHIPAEHRRIGIVLSGGNVDPELFSSIISAR